MKVLWVGDAIAPTGFSRCTHTACDALHAAGHDVRVLGLNYHGDPHPYPYPIHPCYQPHDHGRDGFGVGRLPYFINRYEPDVVVFLNDPWNIPGYIASLLDRLDDSHPLPRLVGYLAVDGTNQQGFGCNDLDLVITWTRYAQNELRSGGYTGLFALAPLGVDHSLYYPRDKSVARSFLGPLRDQVGDSFLVGAVGRNQTRKRLDLTIRYFARWYAEARPDAYLYLHVGPTGDIGVDLNSLTRYYGVKDRVIVGKVSLGTGSPESYMPSVYSMLDLYVSTSQGEGWGLPALEAMACGVPCLLPDWAAYGEWARDAAALVPCTSVALTAPTNGMLHTIGGVADEEQFLDGLHNFYTQSEARELCRERGLECAARYSWRANGAAVLEAITSLSHSTRTVGDLGKSPDPLLPVEAASG